MNTLFDSSHKKTNTQFYCWTIKRSCYEGVRKSFEHKLFLVVTNMNYCELTIVWMFCALLSD